MSVSTRGFTLNQTLQLVTEECCTCGITFAMPASFKQECLDRPESKKFYCPNGHWQWYIGKSPEQRLRDAKRQLEAARSQATHYQDQLRSAENSNRALKGVVTRTKRRIANGVCPCCRRTFKDLAEHMAGQHPDYVEEANQ